MAFLRLFLLVSVLDSVKGSEHRFVAHGSDLQLDVNRAEVDGGDDFEWIFNTTYTVVKFNFGTDPKIFENQANFFNQNYSLLLRNMQHNNSGNYEAKARGRQQKSVAKYTVIVQDQVSPVNLTVIHNDTDFCNFTVMCGTVDSKIGTFQCDNRTCHLLNHRNLKESSLNITIEESSIICNHSNKVSWKQDVLKVESLCKNKTDTNTAITVGISTALVAVAGLVLSVVFIMCKRKRSANTVYEVPQKPPQHNPYENPAEITETPSPTSTYALVQFSNPSVRPSVTSTSTKPQPETIYAQVDRAAKSNPKPAAANT